MIARCHEQVIDPDGFYAPCDRPATTTRIDPEDGHEYPVCRMHRPRPLDRVAHRVTEEQS